MLRKVFSVFGKGRKTPTEFGTNVNAAVIAIGSDSQIDCVDIFPNGLITIQERIRVSVNRPYLGQPLNLTNARLIPVRAMNQSITSREPDDYSTSVNGFEKLATWPYLVLEIWTPDEKPGALSFERAPAEYAFIEQSATATVWEVPACGRRRWDLVVEIAGSTIDLDIEGVDYHISGVDATVTEIVTSLQSTTGIATGDHSFEYEGSPFDTIRATWSAASGLDLEGKIRLYDW